MRGAPPWARRPPNAASLTPPVAHRFDVSVFAATHFFPRHSYDDDDVAGSIRKAVGRRGWQFLPETVAGARDAIADAELDVLVYPEVGLDYFAYQLAFARLAPVQCVYWGHPISQRIPALDYFLTSDLYEPGAAAAAAAHVRPGRHQTSLGVRYDEQPVLLEGLTTGFSFAPVRGKRKRRRRRPWQRSQRYAPAP